MFPTSPETAVRASAQIDNLRRDAAACRACPLWERATQTVFGEGPAEAEIVFVGEQPGDHEDRVGRPFVGRAGHLFDRALAEAGVERERVYVTNAVKHFKFDPRGKLRLHKKPSVGEIGVCKRWLFAEIDALRPRLAVALGATAARSVAGRPLPIASERGKARVLPSGLKLFVTVHPSWLLRIPDETARQAAYAEFVADLRAAAAIASRSDRASAPRAFE